MVDFLVRGPFVIPFERGKGGRHITPKIGKALWEDGDAAGLAGERGCYIFAMKSARGMLPTYVGKATKTFRQEVFASHKCGAHYNRALSTYARAAPMLFLVLHPSQRGKTNKSQIASLEEYLIEQAYWRNPKGLTNVNHRPQYYWSIRGLVRSGRGKRSAAAEKLKALLDI